MTSLQKMGGDGGNLKDKVTKYLIQRFRSDGKIDNSDCKFAEAIALSLERKNGWEGLQVIACERAWINFIYDEEKNTLDVSVRKFLRENGIVGEENKKAA